MKNKRTTTIVLTTVILTLFVLKSFGQCLGNEQAFKDYYKKNISTLDPIEGIWSSNSTTKLYNQYNQLLDSKYNPQAAQWAIITDGNRFKACTIGDNTDYGTIIFSKTATTGVYLYQKTFSGRYAVAKANAIISSGGLLEYSYEVPKEELIYRFGDKYISGMSMTVEIKMIKLFPTLEDIQKSAPSSGTGFAISGDGFIVTNHHVVNSATNINVRGINGDFSKTYKAKIIVEDKNNDLAIIKIDDYSFM